VFASNEDTVKAATDAGATVAGGTSLIESIARGEVPVNFDRALATPDMMSSLSKIARVLGPRGLMPNAKVNTIQPPDKIVDAIKEQASGSLQYRTDKNGVIHAGIGKGSFTDEELFENIKSFMNTIQSVKPESFGKGKKGKGNSKNAKYYLSAYLSSTQSKGSVNINLLTLDVSIQYQH
jgi:large subunit ribosomal protein L1